MKPYFTHDCDRCIHIMSVDMDGKKADVYVCPDEENIKLSSILVRIGDEGPEYYSTSPSCLDSRNGYHAMGWEHGLAISGWIRFQERNRNPKDAKNWCDFVNAGKLFSERFEDQPQSEETVERSRKSWEANFNGGDGCKTIVI